MKASWFDRFEVLWILIVIAWEGNPNAVQAYGNSMDTSPVKVMFRKISAEWLQQIDTDQRNYGVAVADVDFDGDFEFIVAGFTGQNFVLKYDKNLKKLINIAEEGTPFEALMDFDGEAIGVGACDIDGDGKEEIYFLNTNQAYAGRSEYGDKLFKWRNGKYVDLFSDAVNSKLDAKNYAGRSVACIDRYGRGKYGIAVATYSHDGTGKFSLIEMNEFHRQNDVDKGHIVLQNVASEAGIDKATGGRGIIAGSIISDHGKPDLFFDNEGSPWLGNPGSNFMFKNLGNGTFKDVSRDYGIADENQNGRGVSLADFNHDGLIDIVYGNWEGHHRLYIQTVKDNQKYKFVNIATPEFEKPSMVRTVIAADFDNDGNTEVFFNNINDHNVEQPNRLFKITSYGPGQLPGISKIRIGEAIETDGYGTGGAITDMDGDGHVELLLSHGESKSQPLEIYEVVQGKDNNWIRIIPQTKYGAPARGATVQLTTKTGDQQTQIIDSGSGYLCQMEPVAHFGLGSDNLAKINIQWPDGKTKTLMPPYIEAKKVHIIEHPDRHIYQTVEKIIRKVNTTLNGTNASFHAHTEL